MDKYGGKGNMSKEMGRYELLCKIRELEFAAVDINLYLDNHPENQQAVEDYNKFTQELMALKKKYDAEFGPLTNFGYCPSQYPWAWVNEPWPWESGE
jgi:spore coat protein JB